MKEYPNQEKCNELWKYENGHLFWKNRVSNRWKDSRAGYYRKNGYVEVSHKDVKYMVHRIIYIIHYGDIPKELQIDHIDNKKHNNKIENLRLVTPQENQWNINNNRKGYSKWKDKWKTQIWVDGVQIYLGLHKEEEQAAKAYQEAVEKYHIIKDRRPETTTI